MSPAEPPSRWRGTNTIFSTGTIIRSLVVTIGITAAGTLINLLFTSLLAYPLSRQDFDGRRLLMLMIIFTMLFHGGIIPTFPFSLFYAVGHWNTFFSAILHINDSDMWPIQVWLRQIVILSQGGIGDLADSHMRLVNVVGCTDASDLIQSVLRGGKAR